MNKIAIYILSLEVQAFSWFIFCIYLDLPFLPLRGKMLQTALRLLLGLLNASSGTNHGHKEPKQTEKSGVWSRERFFAKPRRWVARAPQTPNSSKGFQQSTFKGKIKGRVPGGVIMRVFHCAARV